MTHGDPVGRSNSRIGNGSNGRQTPNMDSGGEDSSGNTPMSSKTGKMMSVKVLMLDDSITVFQVQVLKTNKYYSQKYYSRILPKTRRSASTHISL